MSLSHKQRRHFVPFQATLSGSEQKAFRPANLIARALFPGNSLRSFQGVQVRIVGLSDNGALLESSVLHYVPDHFYLSLGTREIFITCARSNLVDGIMVVKFAQRESLDFIEALCKIANPLSTLKSMWGLFGPAIQARMGYVNRNQ